MGYDLYVRLLNEAISEERGDVIEAPFESRIELAVDAHIPDEYIHTSAERMEMYKKISYIRGEADVSDVTDELCDRYGEPPRAVLRLLHVAALRAMASVVRIAKIDEKDGTLRFFGESPDLSVWSILFEKYKTLRFVASLSGPVVTYRLQKGEEGVYAAYRILSEYLAARDA